MTAAQLSLPPVAPVRPACRKRTSADNRLQRLVKRKPAPAQYRAVQSPAGTTGESRLRTRVTCVLQHASNQPRMPVPHAVVLAEALKDYASAAASDSNAACNGGLPRQA
ncbi:hypothetical protein XACM_1961 [Xanthomonas euvesicatoria pv. citrumelo F1]|nr:hypothetical protein XACM_1961 [Xanthomonas euvesicatoria pv. citrumelo F1]PPU89714.1 hypothetical protein XaclCFBP3371_06035 [Xanthomonas euvesicatoria pv. citrumelonis]